MKDEWCYYNGYLDKDICNTIINDLRPMTTSAAIGLTGNPVFNTDIRKSKTCFVFADDPKYKYIFDIFWDTAVRANEQFFGFEISKLDFIQFAEYDSFELAEYKPHRDVFWLNNDPVYHRKLSGMIQLSDPNDYDGGEFEITDNTINNLPTPEDIKNRGTILYIPSFVEHRVAPVTRGIRYSLVAWFDGPKWR